MTDTTLNFSILRLPSRASYSPRPRPPDFPLIPANPFTDAETVERTYQYALVGVDRWVQPILLANVTNAYSFRADMQLSNVCTWEITKRFARSDWKQALSLFEAARTPGAFSVWHLSVPEERDIIDNFLGGRGFGNLITFTEGFPGFIGGADVMAAVPSWTQRGAGGLIQDVTVELTGEEEIEIKIRCACWGKNLQETIVRAGLNDAIDRTNFQAVIWDLFLQNSDYEPALLRNLEEGETEAERRESIRNLGNFSRTNGVFPVSLSDTSIAENYRAVSSLGKWCVSPYLTPAAEAHTSALEQRWEVNTGNHTMLREIQRLAENAGLLFSTALPYILFFRPGPRGAIIWDIGKQFPGYRAQFRHLKPRASAWLGTHTDNLGGGRNISVHITDNTLVNNYGEIQTSFLSTAPIILSDDASPYPSSEETTTSLTLPGVGPVPTGQDTNIWRDADYATIRHMIEQVNARAIHERENWSGNMEFPWTSGYRYGIDWYLGDVINPQLFNVPLTGSNSTFAIVRSASIAIRQDGEIRCQAGLGSRADINPQWADQFLRS